MLNKAIILIFLFAFGCTKIDLEDQNALFSKQNQYYEELDNSINNIKNSSSNNIENQYCIFLFFEQDKSDLTYNNNTDLLDLLITRMKNSDTITLCATISKNEHSDIYTKRLNSVKEYLSQKIAIEKIIINKNENSNKDTQYCIICTVKSYL